MIVFSHLRWQFVKQRPQHIVERISEDEPVLFVEEPIGARTDGRLTAKQIRISPNLLVIQPQISSLHIPSLSAIISQFMISLNMENPKMWFYSSSFVDILQYLPYSYVVYDCMDELSAFKNAPADLVLKENELIKKADVIFTGGYSLYQKKKMLHPYVYNFPSSVDKYHFSKAISDVTKIPEDISKIPQPIIGFYGVLDERLDLSLIEYTAKSLPKFSFVLIGPVVKINEKELPILPNIYYLGQKNYQELPGYLKGFDIAYMPFALNDATRFISPTKTLEFIAASKPIVSTAIHDVKHDFDTVVNVTENKREFVNAIKCNINEPFINKIRREILQKNCLMKTSWDNTVVNMKKIISKPRVQKSENSISVFSSGAYNYETT